MVACRPYSRGVACGVSRVVVEVGARLVAAPQRVNVHAGEEEG